MRFNAGRMEDIWNQSITVRGGRESGPIAAVEGAVLDGFGDVADGDVLCSGQVGDGARNLEDAVVGAGGEALLLHGALEQALGVGRELAEGTDLLGVHRSEERRVGKEWRS